MKENFITSNRELNQTKLKIRNIEFSENRIFCLCIALYYMFAILTRVQSAFNTGSFLLGIIIRLGTYCIILFIILGLLGSMKKLTMLLICEGVISLFFLFSIISGSVKNLAWQDVYKLIATTYIPLAFAAYFNTDRKMLMKSIYPVAVISVPVLIFVAFKTYGSWESDYDMTLGYLMVFSALVLLTQFTIDSKIYNLILSILLMVFILFIGSRGPFICVFSFVLLEIFFSNRYRGKQRAILIFSILAIAILVLANYNNILLFLYKVSRDLHFNSRSLQFLMEGVAVSHDSGRNVLRNHYREQIAKQPFFGYGIMGDWISDGLYPHNIIIEFLLSYGYVFGIPLLLMIFFIFIKSLRKNNNRYNNALLILFISYCIHLFVSGSYLKVWQFFVCIALCLPNKNINFSKND